MSRSEHGRRLSSLAVGDRGRILRVRRDNSDRADRLAALGVTPGAAVTLLQTFPSVVFQCDQTEMAVEPAVAHCILVELDPSPR